jgi:lysophospholipase L1-like esterase
MRVTCFGDSICYGDGVRPDRAWVSLLAAELARRRPEAKVINAGVNGETAQDGLLRLSPLLAPPAPDLFYVQFGLNDAWINECSAGEYADAVWKIVNRALEGGVRAVLVGTNHPVWPVWTDEDMYGVESYPARVRRFNADLRSRFALAPERVGLADIEDLWNALGGREAQVPLLQSDGVHLSPRGNSVYADFLLPMFERALASNQGQTLW